MTPWVMKIIYFQLAFTVWPRVTIQRVTIQSRRQAARLAGLGANMGWIQLRKRCASRSGQSLIETALLLPLILLVAFNAINFGYYFVVALHLASAPREGVEYSIQGSTTPAHPILANAGPATAITSVSYLTYHDMTNLSASSTAAVQVCSTINGLNNAGLATQNAMCTPYGTAASPAFPAAASDPESPLFVLHRVDVQYIVSPLIGAMSLNIGGVNLGLLTPNLTFHRQVSMRAIN
jgi:Flp pilus assembly protein TadG